MKKLPNIADDLSITAVAGETIVYNGQTSQAHCLDARGGRVLCACRDRLQPEELVTELGSAQALTAVLQELQELGLLKDSDEPGLGRRQVLSAAGAGIASVLVASVAAPLPAAAATAENCALDSVTNVPCNCTQCGLPCSGSSYINNCFGTIPRGTAPSGYGCCFEYTWAPGSTGPNYCQSEGSGEYRCRKIAALDFDLDCNTARALISFGQYYCCQCTGAPVNLTC